MKNIYLIIIYFVSLSLTAQNTIVNIIADSPDHNTLEAALIAAGLTDTLSTEGPYTVFAPTDEAFAALPEGFLNSLMADPDGILTQILLHHTLKEATLTTDLTNGNITGSQASRDIMVTINDDGFFVNDAKVIVANIKADNGIVHVIDAVLDYRITIFDLVEASVVHTILEEAIIAAGLKDALEAVGPLTLFAPTNDPFTKLTEGKLEELLADPRGDLTDILLDHLVVGRVPSEDLSDGQQITATSDENLLVRINSDDIYINEALIGNADVGADNGIIHVMDDIIFANTTSTLDINNSSVINVHPNPAQNNFTLNLEELKSNQTQVRIVDMKGRTIADFKNVNPTQIFDTTTLLDGVYLIEISSGKNRYIKKLIINR